MCAWSSWYYLTAIPTLHTYSPHYTHYTHYTHYAHYTYQAFLGMYVVAVGAEIPDTIQSVAVARRGYGVIGLGVGFRGRGRGRERGEGEIPDTIPSP